MSKRSAFKIPSSNASITKTQLILPFHSPKIADGTNAFLLALIIVCALHAPAVKDNSLQDCWMPTVYFKLARLPPQQFPWTTFFWHVSFVYQLPITLSSCCCWYWHCKCCWGIWLRDNLISVDEILLHAGSCHIISHVGEKNASLAASTQALW